MPESAGLTKPCVTECNGRAEASAGGTAGRVQAGTEGSPGVSPCTTVLLTDLISYFPESPLAGH